MTTLSIQGDLNFLTVESYIAKADALALSAGETLCVDFSEAADVDSSGVALCLRLLRRATMTGSSVTLSSPSHKMLALLDVCKLKPLFEVN